MPKKLNLPLRIYKDLMKVSDELSLMAKKPISPSMSIYLLIEVYHAHLNNPCALDAFSLQLRNLNLMSPQEFDQYWDESEKQTQRSKKKAKNR